jgi:hypothetical protein
MHARKCGCGVFMALRRQSSKINLRQRQWSCVPKIITVKTRNFTVTRFSHVNKVQKKLIGSVSREFFDVLEASFYTLQVLLLLHVSQVSQVLRNVKCRVFTAARQPQKITERTTLLADLDLT